jgi:hypothetical protein
MCAAWFDCCVAQMFRDILRVRWPFEFSHSQDRNLPCALKAAIGIGKRTLGNPSQSGVPQGLQQGLMAGSYGGFRGHHTPSPSHLGGS